MRFSKLFPKTKPKWAALCSLKHTDKNGLRYYQYIDELDMPLMRKGEIDKCNMELRFGSDYEDVFDALKDALCASDRKGNMQPDLQTASYLTQELIDRRELLVLPDIMMEIASHALIREDENPAIVDREILQEKIEVFKKEIQGGGLHGFFQSSGLLSLIGLSNITILEFSKLIDNSQERLSQFQKITGLCTSGKK